MVFKKRKEGKKKEEEMATERNAHQRKSAFHALLLPPKKVYR
jgi:hypothetical protein